MVPLGSHDLTFLVGSSEDRLKPAWNQAKNQHVQGGLFCLFCVCVFPLETQQGKHGRPL